MCVLVHGYMYSIYLYLQDSCWCGSWWAVESRRVYSSNAPGWNGQDWAAFTSDSTSWPCATFTEVRHTQTRPRWNEQVMKETVFNYVSVCVCFSEQRSHVICWTDLFLWLTQSWLSQKIHRKARAMVFASTYTVHSSDQQIMDVQYIAYIQYIHTELL